MNLDLFKDIFIYFHIYWRKNLCPEDCVTEFIGECHSLRDLHVDASKIAKVACMSTEARIEIIIGDYSRYVRVNGDYCIDAKVSCQADESQTRRQIIDELMMNLVDLVPFHVQNL